MGRKVSRAHAEDRVRYVPDIDENRDDPDPFWVEIEPMDGVELRRVQRSKAGEIKKKVTLDRLMAKDEAIREDIIRSRVVAVHGYAIRDARSGDIVEPRNGKELVAAITAEGTPPAEYAIIDDIYQAILSESQLTEGLLGKLQSVSAGSSVETQPEKGGGVLTVAGDNSQTRTTTGQPETVMVIGS